MWPVAPKIVSRTYALDGRQDRSEFQYPRDVRGGLIEGRSALNDLMLAPAQHGTRHRRSLNPVFRTKLLGGP